MLSLLVVMDDPNTIDPSTDVGKFVDLHDARRPVVRDDGRVSVALAQTMETVHEGRDSRLSVRDAIAADAAAIATLGRTAFMAVHDGLVDARVLGAVTEQAYALPELRRCIARCATAPDAHFLVAEEEDGDIRGFVHFDSFGDRPELHRIYVDRALTGRGVGRALLSELERRIPDGVEYILMVVASNQRAVRFYLREGFEVESQVDDAVELYGRQMGLRLPAARVPLIVMRRIVQHTAEEE